MCAEIADVMLPDHFAIRQSKTILGTILGRGAGLRRIFHGLFSTVCIDFGTNPRKQAQP